ncbi:hypothetical protein [Albibacterium bauzanense]|uniref:Lipocalin-like protein n=1 Tax=Albibacterium bauzanense TaxID=653929 RepID=A0A4R1M2E8_9SPHI|nr:hypothetical protein [Albibacterium bauzanense]TCK85577.1 hypothetical protein C8N28_0888 [Albibacterium bauzanense]
MRRSIPLLLLALVFFITACDKDNLQTNDNTLTGKWKLSETLADSGDGSGEWIPVAKKTPYDYVEFKENGDLAGNLFTEYKSYMLKDDITIQFSIDEDRKQEYRYSIINGVLSMSPSYPMLCIEACGTRYIKVK